MRKPALPVMERTTVKPVKTKYVVMAEQHKMNMSTFIQSLIEENRNLREEIGKIKAKLESLKSNSTMER
jgi:regulator of replication initiation timing